MFLTFILFYKMFDRVDNMVLFQHFSYSVNPTMIL